MSKFIDPEVIIDQMKKVFDQYQEIIRAAIKDEREKNFEAVGIGSYNSGFLRNFIDRQFMRYLEIAQSMINFITINEKGLEEINQKYSCYADAAAKSWFKDLRPEYTEFMNLLQESEDMMKDKFVSR